MTKANVMVVAFVQVHVRGCALLAGALIVLAADRMGFAILAFGRLFLKAAKCAVHRLSQVDDADFYDKSNKRRDIDMFCYQCEQTAQGSVARILESVQEP